LVPASEHLGLKLNAVSLAAQAISKFVGFLNLTLVPIGAGIVPIPAQGSPGPVSVFAGFSQLGFGRDRASPVDLAQPPLDIGQPNSGRSPTVRKEVATFGQNNEVPREALDGGGFGKGQLFELLGDAPPETQAAKVNAELFLVTENKSRGLGHCIIQITGAADGFDGPSKRAQLMGRRKAGQVGTRGCKSALPVLYCSALLLEVIDQGLSLVAEILDADPKIEGRTERLGLGQSKAGANLVQQFLGASGQFAVFTHQTGAVHEILGIAPHLLVDSLNGFCLGEDGRRHGKGCSLESNLG
jgi:hypothetical protein